MNRKYWIIIDQPDKLIPWRRKTKYYSRTCSYEEASEIYSKYLAKAKDDQRVFLAVDVGGEFQLLT